MCFSSKPGTPPAREKGGRRTDPLSRSLPETELRPTASMVAARPACALDSRSWTCYLGRMRVAFKEWAVIVDALGRGEQILILRKGGISEERGGFQVEHPQFLLFPTRFHQQREAVLPAAQARFDQIAPAFPTVDRVRLEFLAEVVAWKRLDSLAVAERLRGQHVWRDDVIAERFDWGKGKNIFALAVKLFRLPQTVELPLLPGYGGCKSWVELDTEIAVEAAQPVLAEAAFADKLEAFHDALAGELRAARP